MDGLHEIAEQHSAGAIVSRTSPFADLPSHKNETELTSEFIVKWAVPFYMEIGKYGDNEWIAAVKRIKGEITKDVCLALLDDFNWRTRLVGAYFAAVKGYAELIDTIGIHLLKSEVCCVGHIYAVTLAFFNTPESVGFLNRYLDYYLTTPELYFDQTEVMNAVLYLDKANRTDDFRKHLSNWKHLNLKRKPLEYERALTVAKILEKQEGKVVATNYLQSFSEDDTEEKIETFSTNYLMSKS